MKSTPKKVVGELLPHFHSAARANKFDAAKRLVALQAISEGKSVEAAARLAGVDRVTIFYVKNSDPGFRAQYEAARELSTDFLDDHLFRHGTERRVPGNFVAVLAMLKARRPQVWRESATVNNNLQLNFTGAFAEAMARAG